MSTHDDLDQLIDELAETDPDVHARWTWRWNGEYSPGSSRLDVATPDSPR